MPTRTILGEDYQTAIMPDGYEWMLENLRYVTATSRDSNLDPANRPTYGCIYTWDEANSLSPGDGWLLPTVADWSALSVACGYGPGTEAGKFKTSGTAHWNAPNTGAENSFSFAVMGAGTAFPGGSYPDNFKVLGGYWTPDVDGSNGRTWGFSKDSIVASGGSNGKDGYWSVRFRRIAPAGFSGARVVSSGAWRNASEVHVAKDGVWRKANKIFVPVSGSWREVS